MPRAYLYCALDYIAIDLWRVILGGTSEGCGAFCRPMLVGSWSAVKPVGLLVVRICEFLGEV